MALGGIIRGKTTTLRTPTEDDLVAFARWMADLRLRRATKVWHEPAMPATWKERLAEQTKEKDSVLWSIEAETRLVGLARVDWGWEPRHDSAHVSHFLVAPDEWRKGYGADAALALHRYLFDYLDLRHVGLELHADNAAAIRICETLGYVEFGHGHEVYYRDGAYVDQLWMLMERATWDERWGAEHREYAPLEGRTTPAGNARERQKGGVG